MANTSLKQTIWATRLLYNLDAALVYGNAVNTDYEGDASTAAFVKINSIGDPTIGDYNVATGMDAPEDISSTDQEFAIDQYKYFNFKVDDILKQQTNIPAVDAAMARTAVGLAEAMDKYVASKYTEVAADNVLDAIVIDTATKAYDFVVDLGVAMDEKNILGAERFTILPAFVKGFMQKDTRFTQFEDIVVNGIAQGKKISGMNVYFSNFVPAVLGKSQVIAGDKRAITFAKGLYAIESYRPEKFFADAVRGQLRYGCKVIKDTGLVLAPISKS